MDLKTHLTTAKVLVLSVVFILVIMVMSKGCGSSTPRFTAADQEKMDALDDAYKNGLLSTDEYQAKRKELTETGITHAVKKTDDDDDENPGGGGDGKGGPTPTYEPGDLKVSSRTKMVRVDDPAWNMTAFQMEIPANWNFEGVLLRNDKCEFLPSVAYRLSSPDGLYGAQLLPEFDSVWTNSDIYKGLDAKSHCKVMEPVDAAGLLNYIVPFSRPNPTIGDVEATNDAQSYQDGCDTESQKTYGKAGLISCTAVIGRIEYLFHGQDIEENIVVHQKTYKKMVIPFNGQNWRWASTGTVTGIRAPKGHLDEAFDKIFTILRTGAITAEWRKRDFQKIHDDQLAIQNWNNQQREITFHNIEASHQAFMQAQQERFDRHNEQMEEQMEAMHRSAQAYVLFASDEQLFRDPGTGETIRTPIEYGNNAWQDPVSQQILLTDNPNVDPNGYLRGTWTQLERVNPMRPDQ